VDLADDPGWSKADIEKGLWKCSTYSGNITSTTNVEKGDSRDFSMRRNIAVNIGAKIGRDRSCQRLLPN
jgi:hypothetical protein